MTIERRGREGSGLPKKLFSPARQVLVEAGYVRLDQLTRVGEEEILKLHGMGPKALEQFRRALAAGGRSLAARP